MAQRTVVQLTDDIDGSEATGTVTFGLDGTTYQVDLNDTHAEDLREILAPYVSVARKVSGSRSRRRTNITAPKQRTNGDVDPKAVRAWAEANSITVSPRGRIKADIVEQYRAAGHRIVGTGSDRPLSTCTQLIICSGLAEAVGWR